jgi:hypothetical protein
MKLGLFNSRLAKKGIAAIAFMLVSGCVSDTLSQQGTQPQPLAEQKTPSYDPVQRDQAVAEIRQKAAQSGSGELTSAYVTNDGPTTPMSPEEQAAKISELEGSAAQNTASVQDAELASKQQSIQQLRNEAKTHYNNAVSTIKN